MNNETLDREHLMKALIIACGRVIASGGNLLEVMTYSGRMTESIVDIDNSNVAVKVDAYLVMKNEARREETGRTPDSNSQSQT